MDQEKRNLLCMKYLINEMKNPLVFSGVSTVTDVLCSTFKGEISFPLTFLSCISLGYLAANVVQLKDKYFTYYEKINNDNSLNMKVSYLYDQLKNEFAELVKKFEITDVLEVYYFYLICLKMGVLSYSGKFKCCKDGVLLQDITKNLGAKVCSGYASSCHINAFLSDLYNILGIESYNVFGVSFADAQAKWQVCKEKVSSLLKQHELVLNSVTLIESLEGKYFLEAFTQGFATAENGKVIEVGNNYLWRDFIYAFQNYGSIEKMDSYRALLGKKLVTVDARKKQLIYNKIYDYIFKYLEEFIKFNADHKDLLKDISENYDNALVLRK